MTKTARPRHATMTTGGGRLRPSFLINFDSMALSRFIDECRLDLDLGAVSIWETGLWDWTAIFPNAQLDVPDIYRSILDREYGRYLPQNHLFFYSYNEERFWVCRYCQFWCDQFDQRVMETHLICRCPQVIKRF
jgi:hypothetical protein